jgi:glycosyltransferase 2 family protein
VSDAETPLAGAARLKRLVQPLLALVAAAFVIVTAVDLVRSWDGRDVHLDLGLAFASLLPVLAGALIQAFAWILLTERMAERRMPRLRGLATYLDSQLARYTPGKIGLPLVRMEGAARFGFSRRLVGASVLIEMLAWTATGGVVGFFLLWMSDVPAEGVAGLAGRYSLPLMLASLIAVLTLVLVDRRRLPAKLRALFGLDGGGRIAPLRLPVLELLYWLTWAVHGYFLTLALGASQQGAIGTMGYNPLANVLGFVALAAPAGVGVREAVLISGYGSLLGSGSALAAAGLSRIVSLIADLGVWAVVRFWVLRNRTQRAP